MSYQDGWAAINLEMPPRVPRTEYSAHKHWRLVTATTGIQVDVQSRFRGGDVLQRGIQWAALPHQGRHRGRRDLANGVMVVIRRKTNQATIVVSQKRLAVEDFGCPANLRGRQVSVFGEGEHEPDFVTPAERYANPHARLRAWAPGWREVVEQLRKRHVDGDL